MYSLFPQQMLNSAVVRLYETDRNGSWSNTGKSGALFVTNEKGSDCNFFKLVDFKVRVLAFQMNYCSQQHSLKN